MLKRQPSKNDLREVQDWEEDHVEESLEDGQEHSSASAQPHHSVMLNQLVLHKRRGKEEHTIQSCDVHMHSQAGSSQWESQRDSGEYIDELNQFAHRRQQQ